MNQHDVQTYRFAARGLYHRHAEGHSINKEGHRRKAILL